MKKIIPLILLAVVFSISHSRVYAVTVAWDAPTNLTESVTYKVYYGVASRTYLYSTNVGTNLSVVITNGITNGARWYFSATAIGSTSALESDYSNEANTNLIARPNVPRNLRLSSLQGWDTARYGYTLLSLQGLEKETKDSPRFQLSQETLAAAFNDEDSKCVAPIQVEIGAEQVLDLTIPTELEKMVSVETSKAAKSAALTNSVPSKITSVEIAPSPLAPYLVDFQKDNCFDLVVYNRSRSTKTLKIDTSDNDSKVRFIR